MPSELCCWCGDAGRHHDRHPQPRRHHRTRGWHLLQARRGGQGWQKDRADPGRPARPGSSPPSCWKAPIWGCTRWCGATPTGLAKPRLFIDADVLIAGSASTTGASYIILHLSDLTLSSLAGTLPIRRLSPDWTIPLGHTGRCSPAPRAIWRSWPMASSPSGRPPA